MPIRAAKVRGNEMSVRTVRLGRQALRETSYCETYVEAYTPDTALVNYYDSTALMGMHQDKDERSLARPSRSPQATPVPSGSVTDIVGDRGPIFRETSLESGF